MSAESEDRHRDEADSNRWILHCEGFRVEDPDGHVGVVVAVVYDPSARWDRPSGFTVRTATGGALTIALEDVEDVLASEGRLLVRSRSG
jgi:hypothetical protein